ncbi:hypothetical protein LOF13_04450 [Klebsiella pneumoniae subsp. pneumoniae]|nr:hypothetical protein LOF13_04450 [Klebsiella pneumoniae subsp. pneumoniae]
MSLVPVRSLYRSDRATGGDKAVGRYFAHFGAKLENVSVGCCGMAGTYGHEVKTTPTRWPFTRSPGSRRCSGCRETAVW